MGDILFFVVGRHNGVPFVTNDDSVLSFLVKIARWTLGVSASLVREPAKKTNAGEWLLGNPEPGERDFFWASQIFCASQIFKINFCQFFLVLYKINHDCTMKSHGRTLKITKKTKHGNLYNGRSTLKNNTIFWRLQGRYISSRALFS